VRKPDFDLFRLRLRKLAALAADPFFRRAFLQGGVAPAIEHRAVLKDLPFDFVVDVGANRGQFSLLCRRLNPQAPIVAFEPQKGPADVYRKVFAGDSLTRLHHCALGPERGEIAMNVSGHDDASSLLTISQAQVENFPGTGAVAQEMVEIGPLTDFLEPQQMGKRSLFKLDVQGFELEVLKSAEPLLPRFAWVYAECSYVPLYEGQALAQEITAYLADHGFRLTGRFNPSYARTDGSLLQADLLFDRSFS
jgi:FkbM family methyltransferase